MPAQPLRTANRPPALQTGLADPIMLSHGEACALIETPADGLDDLLARAGEVRDRGRGRTVTFSKKVFVPLTTLCRDYCGYCTFRRDPGEPGAHTMTPDEVVALVQAGQRLGAKEALFSLGDKPEARFAVHRDFLRRHGHRTTLQYLRAICELTLRESSLLPHVNPGVMSERDLAALREVSVSMGLMLESVSSRLLGPDVNIQAPPNLTPGVYPRLLAAGLNDWGGISPLTIDHINPEAPWPLIPELRRATESLGYTFRERLAIYPEYATRPEFLAERLRPRVGALIDADGLVKEAHEHWRAW